MDNSYSKYEFSPMTQEEFDEMMEEVFREEDEWPFGIPEDVLKQLIGKDND